MFSLSWLNILADLLVNISASWLMLVFIEPQTAKINILTLLSRIIFAILSLVVAKYFKDTYERFYLNR